MKAGCSAQAASECEYEALRGAALRTAARCLPNVVVAPTFGELLAAQPALAVGFLREAALAAKCPCEPDELFLPDSVLAAGLDSKAAAEDPDNRFAKLWAGTGAPAYYLAACERGARKRRSGPYARYRTEPPPGGNPGGVRGPGWARGGAPALRCPEPGLGVRAGGGLAHALRPLRAVPPADRALALRLDTPGDSPAAPPSAGEAAAQQDAWQELLALNRRPTDDGGAGGAGSVDEGEDEEEESEEEDEDTELEAGETSDDGMDGDEEGGNGAGEEGDNEAEGEV